MLPKVTQWKCVDLGSGDFDPEASHPDLWARRHQKESGIPGFESSQFHPREAPGLGPASISSSSYLQLRTCGQGP